MFHDAEAEPGPAAMTTLGRVHLPEAIEDPAQMLFGDAVTRVAHLELDCIIVSWTERQPHLAALRVLDRVAGEIQNDLSQLVGIGANRNGLRR